MPLLFLSTNNFPSMHCISALLQSASREYRLYRLTGTLLLSKANCSTITIGAAQRSMKAWWFAHFIVLLIVLFSFCLLSINPSSTLLLLSGVAVILPASQSTSDRCEYSDGSWESTTLLPGTSLIDHTRIIDHLLGVPVQQKTIHCLLIFCRSFRQMKVIVALSRVHIMS